MAEKKNIVKVNRKEISSQKISEKENFDGIVNTHRNLTKRPIYKQKKFYFLLFLILIITFLVYYSEREANDQINVTTPVSTE